MTKQEFRDALLERIRLPREWGAHWEGVNTGLPATEFIQVDLKNGERWEIKMERVKEGRYPLEPPVGDEIEIS